MGTPEIKSDFESLYHRAFAEHRVRALWNVREIEHPTREEALMITRRLRVEGNLPARHLAERSSRLAVPISKIQSEVLRLLAAHRDPDRQDRVERAALEDAATLESIPSISR
jgi:hypothetical protein